MNNRIFYIMILAFISVHSTTANAQSPKDLIITAETYKKRALPDSALIYYKKAIPEFILGKNIPDLINAYNQTGIILTRQDKYTEAGTYLNEALSKSILLPDSTDLLIATTYIALGVLYGAEKDFKRSLEYHFKSLNIRQKKLGDEHSDVATSHGNIGNIYFRSEDYDKALFHHYKAMQIRENLFGVKSPEVTQSYINIGNALKEKKDLAGALKYYDKALINKIELQGEKHKDVLQLYKMIAEIYELDNNKLQSELYLKKSKGLRD